MKPSEFDRNYYGCPKCGFPLDHETGEWEYTGGVTCACGAFVPLPDIPVPEGSIYLKNFERGKD